MWESKARDQNFLTEPNVHTSGRSKSTKPAVKNTAGQIETVVAPLRLGSTSILLIPSSACEEIQKPTDKEVDDRTAKEATMFFKGHPKS